MTAAPSTNRMLDGIRIIALTTGYAGPYAGRLLAQYGAEVIKVESASGGLDTFRYYGRTDDPDASPRFIECNLGTRSVTVNLKHPIGVRIVKDLAGRSDGVLINFRPNVLERLGLGDGELRAANERLIILKMPGLGERGPKSGYGTWGFNLNAFCGMTHLWNHPGQSRPIGNQGVYPDHLGFIMAPTIMVAALLRRRVTGKGVSIDLAQAEATAYTLGVSYLDATVNRRDPQPRGNQDPVAIPQGCYRCQGEDRWCVVSVRTEEQWRRLCRVMGRDALADDPRFADRPARARHRSELDRIIQEWTGSRTAHEVMERLRAEKIPAGIVQTGADLLADPQLRHRRYFERFESSPIGPFDVPRCALAFGGMVQEPLALPARLGADTDDILRDLLGYDHATIDRWRGEGILA